MSWFGRMFKETTVESRVNRMVASNVLPGHPSHDKSQDELEQSNDADERTIHAERERVHAFVAKGSPDQARDEHGRWSAGDHASVMRNTEEAYSRHRYTEGGWKNSAKMLEARGHSPDEATAILNSKHMRWAGDSASKDRGVTSSDFRRYMDNPHNKFPAPGKVMDDMKKIEKGSKGQPFNNGGEQEDAEDQDESNNGGQDNDGSQVAGAANKPPKTPRGYQSDVEDADATNQ